MSYTLEPEILKLCDIRGIYGKELFIEDAYHIARSFGTLLSREHLTSCAVGFDVRHSSRGLAERLVAGLRDCGIAVSLLGMVPSPALYFAVKHLNLDAGVVVTASHNPAEYNGFKFVLHDQLFHGEKIEQLGRVIREGDYVSCKDNGTLTDIDIGPDYIRYLTSFAQIPVKRQLKVVWDPGNGASSILLGQLIAQLPGSHTIICEEPDGSFPNHHPDPSLPENMEMLQNRVSEIGADCGIAFDGDGDRIGVVAGNGRILKGDQLLVLFARDFLKTNPGSPVMSEVKASSFFYEDVALHGGIPVMWKVGHTNQKEKMLQDGIQLAGETSGHIFFRENHGFDDAFFAAVKLLNILSRTEPTLAELTEAFPELYDSGEIRLKLDGIERNRLLSEIGERLRAAGREFVDLDGVRVPCGRGFWMLRGSNTQPHITIRCESATEKGLQHCLEEVCSQVEASGFHFQRRQEAARSPEEH